MTISKYNYSIITGVTGLLGSALAEQFIEDGKKVIGIGRQPKGFLSENVLNSNNFIFIQKDIKDLLEDDFEGYEIENIFHLASIVEYAGKDFNEYIKKSINLTTAIIELAQKLNIKTIIFSSTMGIAKSPESKEMIKETSPVSPMTHYTLAKYVSEKLLEIESLKNPDTKYISIRFPSILGKNHFGGIIHTLKENAIKNEDIELYGRGESLRNIIYIDDAVDIMIEAAKFASKLNSYELFLAGSSNSLSVKEIAQKLVELTGSKSKIILSDKPLRNKANDLIDISKAKKILGYSPLTIEEGVKKYIKELN